MGSGKVWLGLRSRWLGGWCVLWWRLWRFLPFFFSFFFFLLAVVCGSGFGSVWVVGRGSLILGLCV